MAHYTVLGEAELAAVMGAFGLPAPDRVRPEPKGVMNTNYHVWSGGRRFFLRISEGKSAADLAFEVEVLRYLAEARYPAPVLLPAADGRAVVEVAGRPAVLFAYAPGEELTAADVGPEACRRVGEHLARLHELAAGFPGSRPNPYGLARVKEWVAGIGGDGGGDREVAAALPLFEEEHALARALPGAPSGLVHGDLFRDNVLWIGGRVAAVLDWEMSCTVPFALDLGIALCAWCWVEAGGFDGTRAAALLAGYRGKRRTEPETLAALFAWTRFAALRFAVSRIHDYARASVGADRLVKKDWRTYRDRLTALRGMGEEGFASLVKV
jgi:homoserine kinase type II